MKRKIAIGSGVLFLAALAAGVYFVGSRTQVEDLTELAVQGGERLLRSEMRAAKPGPRVLIFALDGVGDHEFREVVRSGRAPRISALLGAERAEGVYDHGYDVAEAVSILPSTTMAAWASVYSGEPPGRTGIPGNEWFARDEKRFYAPAPVTVPQHDHTLKMLTDGLMGDALRTPTIFEILDRRAFVSLAPVYRGADLFSTPEPLVVAELFGELVKGLVGDAGISQEAYSEIDQESVEKVVEAIGRYGVADLQVIYWPGVDLFSHVADDPLNRQKEYVETVLDPAVGAVLNAYQSAGALEETFVLFIADHGHTPVLNDDLHSLSTTGDDEPPALIEGLGFRMREFVLEPDEDEQDYQAVIAYQGAMAYVYLADRSLCPEEGDRCDWKRGPRLEEDVMPVVRAFHRVNETGDPIPQLKGTIDLIFAREPRPVDQDSTAFKVFDGEGLIPIGDYLRLRPRPDLIRLEERMEGLAVGPYGHRAGDVLLLAPSGLERPIEERFYFSGEYRSWHGSPTYQDSRVPFVVARWGDSGERLRAVVRSVVGDRPSQLHLVPLVRFLMTGS